MTINELKEAYNQKELTCAKMTDSCLQKLEVNKYNSVVHVARGDALAAAVQEDRNLSRGEAALLTGVPLVIKDNISVKNMPMTCASNVFKDFVPTTDADAVAKLRAAGAVILAKSNMDELAMGSGGETSVFGAAKNPHDVTRSAGGSSSGSAVAVAAGECIGALGTDTGGSIRQPAAFCGVVGFKPTHGAISNNGVVPVAESLDQVGVFAKTVTDCILLFCAASGKKADLKTADLKGKKIAVIKEFSSVKTEESVINAFSAALKSLVRAGAQIVECSLPFDTEIMYKTLSSAEIAANMARYSGYGEEVERRVAYGNFLKEEKETLRHTLKLRKDLIAATKEIFSRADVIVTPTTPFTAFKIGEGLAEQGKKTDVFLPFANLAELPAISVPYPVKGMPVGIQFAGDKFRDSELLKFALAFEAGI